MLGRAQPGIAPGCFQQACRQNQIAGLLREAAQQFPGSAEVLAQPTLLEAQVAASQYVLAREVARVGMIKALV